MDWITNNFLPEAVLVYFMPIFAIAIIGEILYSYKKQKGWYNFKNVMTNGNLAISFKIVEMAGTYYVIRSFYQYFYDHGLQAMPAGILGGVIAFVLQDFLYYWFHRASHNVRWLWASHVTHHSATHMNLSVAFRQNFMYLISGMWVFWIPMAILGFDEKWIIIVVELNLGYQFFVHTELTRNWKWLGKVFNTALYHRIHHVRNPELADHNFAGVLIIWDKLFGTFIPDEQGQTLDYGIRRQMPSHNILKLDLHEWLDMFKCAWATKDVRVLWRHPEWVYRENKIKHPEYEK